MEGRVYDLAKVLLDCVCERLAVECLARACVVPGLPSFENCCEGPTGGQLTVQVVRRFNSKQFPIPDFGAEFGVSRNCPSPYLVTEYQVTIVRCVPTGGVSGPTCAQLDATAQLTLRDLERVWDSVSCCLQDEDTLRALLHGPYRWVIASQDVVEPEGGCAGSTLNVLVGIPPCLECPE